MALEFIGNAKNISPQKPFFMYYCPGTGHAPHDIFTEWSDKCFWQVQGQVRHGLG